MAEVAKDLLGWYDTERRDLPWRAAPGKHANPYNVWLSEVMLQQTTVATVTTYYQKFLNLWPTVHDLAAAPLEEVLKEWAGLGYYARARNLHKCARSVVDEHDGKFPDTETGLRALPGIGDYTAAAIAAIAFDKPAVVVDGNIERVVSRLNRIEDQLPAAKKAIKTATAGITPNKRPGDFAQAMMDLGSGICTPKKPKCLLCPIGIHCNARAGGDMERFPVKAPKKQKPVRRAISFWLEHDGHILLERRPDQGLLGGMPGLFSTPWVERTDFPASGEWQEHAPVDGEWLLLDEVARHTFTHFHLESRLAIKTTDRRLNIRQGFWHPHRALDQVGLPTAFSKIVRLKP